MFVVFYHCAGSSTLTNTQTASTTKEPWSEISEKLTQAAGLYQKLPASPGDDDTNSNIAFVYISSITRHSLALFSIWASKGWGPHAFSAMLHPVNARMLFTEINAVLSKSLYLDSLTASSRITRGEICSVLAQAHGPWILHLGARDRVEILRSMARLYATLDFRRKEAYILRELVGCIMDVLACGREERPPQLTPSLECLRDGSPSVPQGGDIGFRESEDCTGNDAILRLIERLCIVFGLNLNSTQFANEEEKGSPQIFPGYLVQSAVDVVTNSYGWPPLQTAVLQEVMLVVEALPGKLCCPAYCDLLSDGILVQIIHRSFCLDYRR